MSVEQQGANMTVVEQAANPPVKAMWICMVIAWVLFLLPIPGTVLLAAPVNLAALILAIVCLVKGAVGSGIIGLIGTSLGSVIIYIIGAALTVGGIAVLSAPQ